MEDRWEKTWPGAVRAARFWRGTVGDTAGGNPGFGTLRPRGRGGQRRRRLRPGESASGASGAYPGNTGSGRSGDRRRGRTGDLREGPLGTLCFSPAGVGNPGNLSTIFPQFFLKQPGSELRRREPHNCPFSWHFSVTFLLQSVLSAAGGCLGPPLKAAWHAALKRRGFLAGGASLCALSGVQGGCCNIVHFFGSQLKIKEI